MKKRDEYNTKQKDIIVDTIKKHKDPFIVKDIYEELNREVGLTTIYRLTDKLVKEGKLNRTIGKDNLVFYQYLEECHEENHFFLKCEKCGNLLHIDCDCIEEISKHIFKEHNFVLTDHLIINGICDKCMKGSNK